MLDYRPRDYWNFGYKDMDESMGPVYYNCPARILDLLTEPVNETAREWRQRCRERLKRKERARQLRPGVVVRFRAPLHFTDGRVADTFKVVEVVRRGRRRLLFESGGWLYQIRSLDRLEWEVLPPQGAPVQVDGAQAKWLV